ncbi:DUF6310 domain-containing protein [Archangium gephyra]|uniref:DUF6310 domain-containing protein n=1 Tax=Archangium gephyra TaxID=48 RepID=UPI00308413CE
MLVERCFHALDHDRIEFHDPTGKCAVASAGAAAVGLGVCVLAAPELVVGAVIITGVVVMGFAIREALDAYALDMGRPEVRPAPETRPVPETAPAPQKPSPKKRPKPEPRGPDFPPIGPIEVTERDRPRCEPDPVPYHLGGNKLHDKCADRIPNNSFPGGDVFVNGKNFDALQLATRTLWEVKTDNFDTYPPDLRRIVLDDQVPKMRLERDLARACGFDFRVGVRSAAHQAALERAAPELEDLIVVMEWC